MQATTTDAPATFVLSWSQTEIDGQPAAAPQALVPGGLWRWGGTPLRIDARGELLRLEGPEGGEDIRRRAARMVRRLIGLAVADTQTAVLPGPRGCDPADAAWDGAEDGDDFGFAVSDGLRSWAATILPVPDSGARLVMFLGEMPPADCDLWVIRARPAPDPGAKLPGGGFGGSPGGGLGDGGVICFGPGTRLLTPGGLRPIEDIREGDLVDTRDSGPQRVRWTGHRRMSGARLHALPHLRPVRFRAGALGTGRPEGDLLVSPRHRMLVRGPVARILFNCDEVLAAAEDLVDGQSILVERGLREVSYHHLLLDRHEIIFANGLETESFHPAATALDMIDAADRARLLALLPDVAFDAMRYGGFARRNLSAGEASLLRHGGAA